MKRIVVLIFALTLLISFSAASEDLAEAAKKEKARREELAKKGKKGKVYTNADIENLKATLAIETEAPAQTETTTPSAETTTPTPAEPAAAETETSKAAEEEAQNQQIDQQISEMQAEIDRLQREADEARGQLKAGGTLHTHNIGQAYKTASDNEAKIEELKKKIEDLRKQKQ